MSPLSVKDLSIYSTLERAIDLVLASNGRLPP